MNLFLSSTMPFWDSVFSISNYPAQLALMGTCRRLRNLGLLPRHVKERETWAKIHEWVISMRQNSGDTTLSEKHPLRDRLTEFGQQLTIEQALTRRGSGRYSEAQVSKYEERIGCQLPEDFRIWLTCFSRFIPLLTVKLFTGGKKQMTWKISEFDLDSTIRDGEFPMSLEMNVTTIDYHYDSDETFQINETVFQQKNLTDGCIVIWVLQGRIYHLVIRGERKGEIWCETMLLPYLEMYFTREAGSFSEFLLQNIARAGSLEVEEKLKNVVE